ncbi:MAG: phosphatidate cytidylyltransferase [Bacteroidales bacterium]|nr:phosphatidate cytidylyltransferase [Bacteroidales bacterium]
MKTLAIRTLTGILFVAAVVGSLLLYDSTPQFFYLLFLLFSVIGSYELIRMSENRGHRPNMPIAILLAVIPFSGLALSSFFSGFILSFFLIIAMFLLSTVHLVIELFRGVRGTLSNVAITYLPVFYVGVPFSLLYTWLSVGAANVVIALFIILWTNDTLAYCVGSLLGKHKLCEKISPKKSVEGFVGALVLTVGASVIFQWIPYFESDMLNTPWRWVGFGLVVVLFGTFGDLIESKFKRSCGVKDSGRFLPGHGGVLDRFDSALLAIPMAFIYFVLLEFLD